MTEHAHSHPGHHLPGHDLPGAEPPGAELPGAGHRFERHCDVAVIGGSAAGLAAALQMGRQRRSVIVIDAGEPRNAAAGHIHGYLGHEGLPPADFTAIGRDEVRRYGAEVLAGRVVDVSPTDDGGFRVDADGGLVVFARRVLAATGLVDDLPDIDGVAEQWGRGVIHCPFCHGYEARDRSVVQILTHPMGLHPAGLFWQLTDRLTLVLHDGVASDDERLAGLRAAGVRVVVGRVRRVVTGDDGALTGVELVDGEHLEADAVVVTARFRVRVEPFASLGLVSTEHLSGLGDHIEVDAMGETSIPGVFAAGNVTDPMQQVLQAAANGNRVGAMIAASLAAADLAAATRRSANEHEWDERYNGDQVWSGNPNGALIAEVASMAPGRVLDVGAGEGGDAVWLADNGWQVTATDVSGSALDRVVDAAGARGLEVATVQVDANGLDPFAIGAFDLVTCHYPSIGRTPDGRGVVNLLSAVAKCGTLLVVSHDVESMRLDIASVGASQMFDPDAYVHADDVARVVASTPGWTIDVHERRERPVGAASHHVHDVVLRAHRS